MQWEAFALTDVGLRRARNEDAHLVLPESGMFAVADGMGGHAAGEVASNLAIETVRSLAPPQPPARASAGHARLLTGIVRAANTAILEAGRADPACAGMGTTLSLLSLIPGASCYRIAHVGDSRVYRMRRGRLRQLTIDHTWVQEQVEDGLMTPRQARFHPLSSVLTRSLGVFESIDVDVRRGSAQLDDVFLLCSDGLSGMLEDEEMRTVLRGETSLARAAENLVKAANANGGHDNITVLLVRVAA